MIAMKATEVAAVAAAAEAAEAAAEAAAVAAEAAATVTPTLYKKKDMSARKREPSKGKRRR
jgi:hypothetical protein